MALLKLKGDKFSERQKKILIDVAETLLPPGAGAPFRATEANFVKPAETYLCGIGVGVVRGFGMLLYIFEYFSVVSFPYFKRFSKLNTDKKEQYLEGWENSRLGLKRQMFMVIKFLTCLIILNDKDVRASIGYDPGCLVEVRK